VRTSSSNESSGQGLMWVAIALACVACAELLGHWYMGSAPGLLRFLYLSEDSRNHRLVYAGLIDNTVPSALLGLVNGRARAKQPRRWLYGVAPLLGACVALLLPLYRDVWGASSLPWWPQDGGVDLFGLMGFNFITSSLVVGFFTYGGTQFAVGKKVVSRKVTKD
jgi:hypothetical protein